MYQIQFSNQSLKYIENLDIKRKNQIKDIILKLQQNPFSIPYKKMVNTENDYRIRTGNHRIIYSVYKNELLIRIIKIGKRENVYE